MCYDLALAYVYVYVTNICLYCILLLIALDGVLCYEWDGT
jgi:hypothetical protein